MVASWKRTFLCWASFVKLRSVSWTNSLFKGSVSRDFWPLFFPWFKPIWAPDKQAKVFSNLVSISPWYSITKFEKFNCAVCTTLRSQNFRLSKSKSFLQIFSFMIDVFTPKGFFLIVPLKEPETHKDFDFGFAECSLILRWEAHHGVWLRGGPLTKGKNGFAAQLVF